MLRQQTGVLTAASLLFVVGLLIVPNENVLTYFPIFKIVLLFIVPIIIFNIYTEKNSNNKDVAQKSFYLKNNQWISPLLITAIWIVLYFFSPLSMPQAPEYETGLSMLIIDAFRSFMINSVLEELFYRVWLQTRLKALLGTWPAIMVSALLWAVWHMAIQGENWLLHKRKNMRFSLIVSHGKLKLNKIAQKYINKNENERRSAYDVK